MSEDRWCAVLSHSAVSDQTPLSMEILPARILEWVAMPSSRESIELRNRAQVSTLQVNSLPSEPPRKPMNTRGGSQSLLHPGIELGSFALQADSYPPELPEKPRSEGTRC